MIAYSYKYVVPKVRPALKRGGNDACQQQAQDAWQQVQKSEQRADTAEKRAADAEQSARNEKQRAYTAEAELAKYKERFGALK